MTTWNLEELTQFIDDSSDLANKEILQNSINSIGKSVAIFRYHVFTAQDTITNILKNADLTEAQNFKILFDLSSAPEGMMAKRIIIEAHLLAATHLARNIFDMFSQIVNGLLLKEMISYEKCHIKNVTEALDEGELKNLLKALLKDKWFRYVEAFSNTSKHRGLISNVTRVSLTENRLGVFIEKFEYGKEVFDGLWAEAFLEGVVSVKNEIVTCGIALNKACGVRA